MSTLHLSVINDGDTYEERLRIARASISDANKFHQYARLVCRQADYEERHYEMSKPFTLDEISAATTEVFRYMERHIVEFTL